MLKSNQNMLAVYFTVGASVIGMSLPFPVFSQLFLQSDLLLPSGASQSIRTGYLGLALALFPLGQIVASPLWGRLSDAWARKPTLMTSLCVTCLGMVIVSWSINYHHLYGLFLGRLISGLGEGNIAIAQAMATDGYDRQQRARHFAGIAMASNIAWMIGPLLGGVLGDGDISRYFNASVPFELASLIYFLNIIIVWRFVHKQSSKQPSKQPSKQQTATQPQPLNMQPFKQVFNLPFAQLMLICLAIFLAVYLKFLYFAPLLLTRFHFSVIEIGVCTALFGLPMLMTSLVAERLTSKIGKYRLLLIAIALLVVGLLTLISARSIAFLVIPSIFIGVGFVIAEVVTGLMVSDTSNQASLGLTMGVYRSVLVSAEILAALVGGWLIGITLNLPFLAAIAVLFMIIPVILLKKKRMKTGN